MLELLKWDKPLTVNGQTFKNASEARTAFENYVGDIEIILSQNNSYNEQNESDSKETNNSTLRIYVKTYMTKKSNPDFDFMKKWNNDIPMPMRLMEGEIIDETKGMYKMKLRGVYVENAVNCSHCGRKLTNPVSQMYGIGPVCGKHFHIAPPETVEDFKARKEEIKKAIESVTWEGWVIKSAITSKKEIKEAQMA